MLDRRFEHHGANIAYAVRGDGPPLLLLHGGLSDAESDFGSVLPRLFGRFRVVLMDTRGHGRSSWGRTPLSYASFADDAASLLRYLSMLPATVLGISDGGISGLQLALRNPERVNRLIAIGAGVDISGDTVSGGPLIRHANAATFAASQPGQLSRWQSLSPEPSEVLPFVDALMTEVWHPPVYLTHGDLRQVTTPTALVQGDRDEYVTKAHAEEMHRLIGGSTLSVVPDCGHMIFESNPVAAWQVIEPLLGG